MWIEALAAAHGDAIVVTWTGPGGSIRRGLVDGGPANSSANLLQRHLASLAAESGGGPLALDFVCVSHIDDDHIGGIERLFTKVRRLQRDGLPLPVTVRRLWFNSWQHLGMKEATVASVTAEPVVGASVRQGRDLRDVARLLRVDGNAPLGGAFLAGAAVDLDGLHVDVVAPGQNQLDKLFELWSETEGEPQVFAAAYKDRKVPNLSSIALLVAQGGRQALLTGDARGDHVLAGLSGAGLLAGGHLHVDVLKLPHHGSINNVAADFFDAVSADHYVVSADGVTHGLPNTESLDLLLASRQPGDEFELLLTNPMPAVEAHLATAIGARPVTVRVRHDGERGIADRTGP